jgi:hypothetical protein
MIPPQLVVGTTVSRAKVEAFVPCCISAYPERQPNEPAGVRGRSSAWLTCHVQFDRAVMEGRSLQDNDAATFAIFPSGQLCIRRCRWRDTDCLSALVSHRLDRYIVRV